MFMLIENLTNLYMLMFYDLNYIVDLKELNVLSWISFEIISIIYSSHWPFIASLCFYIIVYVQSGFYTFAYLPEFVFFIFLLYTFMKFVYYAESGWESEQVEYIFVNPAIVSATNLYYASFWTTVGQGLFVLPVFLYKPLAGVLHTVIGFVLSIVHTFLYNVIIGDLLTYIINWFSALIVISNLANYKKIGWLFLDVLEVNSFTLVMKFLITVCFTFIFWQLTLYCKNNTIQYYEYPFFFGFLLIGFWLALVASTYTLLYIILELQGLCLILIISVSTRLTQSLQTALRYALINIIGSLFLLYGIIRYVLLSANNLFYLKFLQLKSSLSSIAEYQNIFFKLYWNEALNGSKDFVEDYEFTPLPYYSWYFFQKVSANTNYKPWSLWNKHAEYNFYCSTEHLCNNFTYTFEDTATYVSWTIIPFVFLTLGLCIKLGVGPFAVWVPGVYAGMNLMSLMIFATVPKFIYTYILVYLVGTNRILFVTNNMDYLFFFLALCSLIIGTFGLFKEKYNLFRFLGWSTIVNFSLVMLAFGFLVVDASQITNIYILFFVFYYSVSLLFFLGAFNHLHFRDVNKTFSMFTDVQVLVRNRELYPLVFIFVGSLFSFLGLPPFMGFWGKLYLLKGMVMASQYWYHFVLILIFFFGILIGSFTYIKLFNIIAIERYKDNTYLSLVAINPYRLRRFYITFVQMQIIAFLVLTYGIGFIPII